MTGFPVRSFSPLSERSIISPLDAQTLLESIDLPEKKSVDFARRPA